MPRLILSVQRNQLPAYEEREKRPKPRLVRIVLSRAYDLDKLEVDLLNNVVWIVHMVVPLHEPADGWRVEIEEAHPRRLVTARNLDSQLLKQSQ
jgi:hypothetical protein